MNHIGRLDPPFTMIERSSPGNQALSLLIVDPDIEGAHRLAKALTIPVTIQIVGTAQAAVAELRARLPDLLMTELDLPGASGLQLLSMIYSTPATHNVLLLVVTARTAVRDKIAAFQAGADDFVVKPIDPQRLQQHVLQLCRFRQVIGRGPQAQRA